MNAANEVAVDAFLRGLISFTTIHKITAEVTSGTMFVAEPQLEDIIKTDAGARAFAIEILKKYKA